MAFDARSLVLVLSCSFALGCPSTPTSDDTGSGIDAPMDAAAPVLDGGRDAGAEDGGLDGGLDAGAGDGGHDSGTATDAPISCEPRTATLPTATAVCARSTLECITMATTAAAQSACVAADPNAVPCRGCLDQQLWNSCTTRGFCNAELGRYLCCVEAACPTGELACTLASRSAGGACADPASALATCTTAGVMARRCGITALCFGS